jgi:hypothetical protein
MPRDLGDVGLVTAKRATGRKWTKTTLLQIVT